MYESIIFKTALLYFFIVLCYRLMGKKEISKLSIIDLIVSILIAELAAMSIEETERSIFISIVPIVVLVILEVVLSYITLRSSSFRQIFEGKPKVIINKGKVCFSEMKKMRYSLDDLITQLRDKSVKSINDVNYAIMENNGKLSVFTDGDTYPMPVIVEGKIDFDTLSNLNKDINWIEKILYDNKVKLSEIFYAFYSKNKTYIIKKN